jgi:hypothetical protein
METKKFYEELVKHPGKFEDEPVYTPYFYDVIMNGDGNYITKNIIQIPINEDDIKIFPELQGKKYIFISWDDNGFIYHSF